MLHERACLRSKFNTTALDPTMRRPRASQAIGGATRTSRIWANVGSPVNGSLGQPFIELRQSAWFPNLSIAPTTHRVGIRFPMLQTTGLPSLRTAPEKMNCRMSKLGTMLCARSEDGATAEMMSPIAAPAMKPSRSVTRKPMANGIFWVGVGLNATETITVIDAD